MPARRIIHVYITTATDKFTHFTLTAGGPLAIKGIVGARVARHKFQLLSGLMALLPHPEHAVHIAVQKEKDRVEAGVLVLADVSIRATKRTGPAATCTGEQDSTKIGTK
jgi:hypothetical protein